MAACVRRACARLWTTRPAAQPTLEDPLKRHLRSIVLLPALTLALVVLPALLLSWGGAPQVALGQTVPPPPTATTEPTEPPPPEASATPLPTPPTPVSPPPTVRPTAGPTLRPTRPPAAAPTAAPAPHATPRPGADGRVRVLGSVMVRAIGDRRSATVYGYTEAGLLFRSDDNGIYFETVSESPAVLDFLFSPANPSLLFSSLPLVCSKEEGEAAPLQVSEDSGLTWQTVEGAPALEPLWADAEDELRALAAGCDGLYATSDGGASWELLTAAGDPLWQTARAVEIEQANGYLYALLRPASQGAVTAGAAIAAAATAAIADADAIAVSDDEGATWMVISPIGLQPPFAASALAVDPATPGRLWATGPQGVWVTEDQGQFWGLSAGGLDAALGDELESGLHDIVFHPRELLYVASSAGFYNKRTTDLTWRKLGSETVNLRIESLLLAEDAPRRLWLNTEVGVYRFLIR